jgi:branched-chain amino acid transport system ATP-binding protein
MIELSRTTSVPNAGEIILMASDIAVQFGGLKAVDGVSLEVRRGEIVGMIGANGAGKTTFFQVLSGFVKPTAGEVRFRGERIDGLAPELICRRGLTRTFQIAEVFQSLTVWETLTTAALVSMPLAEARKVAVATAELVRLKDKLDFTCRQLTLMDQKALEIGKAVATQPEMILLDEVMAGLRPSETDEVVALIRDLRQRGITFLVVEHIMDVIMAISDRIVVFGAGCKVADGRPEDVVRNRKVIEIYLGEEFELA